VAIGLGLITTIVATLALSQYLQDQMARHLIDKVLVSQKLRIQEKVDRFDSTLRLAEASVMRYAALISDERYVNLSVQPFTRTFQRHPDGSWRLPRSRFDPRLDANAWIPPDVPLTEDNQRFFLHALEVTRQFGQGALRDPLVNSWLLPLVNGMTAFWPTKPDYLYNADSRLDYRRTPWVTLTDPQRNPRGEPRWVGPEYDPAAHDWSISVVAPFRRHGRWAGSLGHDMVVSRLLANLFDPRDFSVSTLARPLFVAGVGGQLLAKPGAVPGRGERAPAAYLPLLAMPQRQGELSVLPRGSNYLVVASIPTLKARVIYRVDGGWLRQSVGRELLGLQLGQGLFVLLVVGSVIGMGVRDGQARRQQQRLLEQRNRELSELARLDQLTRLPNRLGLIESANRCLERARRRQCELLVAFLDLDRFKLINDSMGHSSGDALLQAVGERLRRTVRSTDTVARLGGDEFVVIIEDLDDYYDAGHVAEKLHQAFRDPVLIDGSPITISPSIGVSVFPDDGEDVETLMRQADMAMYEVKSKGRDGWMFFTEQMNRTIQERLTLERDMRIALERGEFHVVYQPQWELNSNRLTGWEALLRWDHPSRGPTPPEVFIPIAEDTGLIGKLGLLVLRTACQEAVRWQKEQLGTYGISVNVSARQFAVSDLENQVDQALAISGLDPCLLELEITESVMIENPRRTQELLNHFRRRGIRVAIDDFGTGYSSLSYLIRFPIDRLKIDRSFVASSLNDANGALIVEAVISLARALGVGAIAEGVETEEQRCFLQRQGCDQIQGTLLGPPMAAAAIADFLGRLPRLACPAGSADLSAANRPGQRTTETASPASDPTP
jgi:diguanylate cyclase (GGDEF)-like protein